ncbi:GlxA family transcriptional regulator [Pseudonocardia humida]|uniref:Helix-turn-helix domain-containing protein n=1 Tax=Pseudonocardia humida TaxID=2800819 RepID=A0ABT0ZW74_9PSEU|nr:helix-turn-helix domain-containing protein [Pseudonocardia humida]MCO1654999.1 helix-turn-helix domain-containing protein [Pseudonocardia humida]
MHRVAVLAFDGVVPFDLALPVEVFGRARLADGRPAYEVLVCAATPQVAAGLVALRVPHGLGALAAADTVVVPGVADAERSVPGAVLDALRTAPGRKVSICAGAFVLAAAGLLDGRRATTHWAAAAELARRHPAVRVDPDVLYVDEGDVLTSAGAAAGLDLCLHLVRRDHGAAVAADAARASVMPLERAGGQAQFVAHEPPGPAGGSLEPLLGWLVENLHRPLTLDDIAARAVMSTRSLSRRFREQTGSTPAHWLRRHRVRRAQQLLESTDRPVERIGEDVGFASPTAFRQRFREVVGVSPRDYRRAFRAG